MVAFNHDSRFPPLGSKPALPVNRLAERVRHYFNQHPEVGREEFLFDALQREIVFLEKKDISSGAGAVRREDANSNRRHTIRPALTAEDILIHAWLAERLAVLH